MTLPAAPLEELSLSAHTYQLHERVGEGGMGRVYRADQLDPRRMVAIKILRPEWATRPEMRRRFHDEALALERLRGLASVVQLIEHGETSEGLPCTVTEWIGGRVLRCVIAVDHPLSLRRVAGFGEQILRAVEDVHARGIIHGDLTATNVIVQVDRRGVETARLIDFDLAGLRDSRDAGGPAFSPRGLCGTPNYLAPEVIVGEDRSVLSDIYAVGAIAYELLTGVPPFYRGRPCAILARQVQHAPEPPSLRCPREIPPALDEVILRALAKDPARRFASAADFRAALLDAMAGEPAHVVRAPRRARVGREQARRRSRRRLQGVR